MLCPTTENVLKSALMDITSRTENARLKVANPDSTLTETTVLNAQDIPILKNVTMLAQLEPNLLVKTVSIFVS